MKVCLLYSDRERSNEETYYDTASIIKDAKMIDFFISASYYFGAKIRKNHEIVGYLAELMYFCT